MFVFLFAAAVSVFMLSPHDCRERRLGRERFLPLSTGDHLRHSCGRESAAARALMQPLNAGAQADLSKGTHTLSGTQTYH